MNDTESARRRALARLDALVGDWTEQVGLPGVPAGRMSFRWTLDGHFLLQRSEIPNPDFPDSVAIIALATDGTGYTQHYFDSRGVVRTYAMTLDERTWTLLRDRPDFTPLHFAQRFTGTFATDGNTISAAWETSDGDHWHKDFDLTYTRIPAIPDPAASQVGNDTP
jgi:hypothetical protein